MTLKKLLKTAIQKPIEDKTSVALLFSGGTDSLTCLFSLLELDIKPTLYTFYLEGKPNKDLEYSKKVSEHYSLEHIIIEIPYSLSELEEKVVYIIKNLPVDRKTNVQCMFPFLYVIPQVKEKYVVSGLCADDVYGTAKSVAIKGAKDKEVFDLIREKTRSSFNSSAYLPIKEYIEEIHEKTFIVPYRSQEVHDYFMKKSWAELNKPKQKQIAIDAFSTYFKEQDIYRKNSNLQVESGVREYHNELIKSPLNKNSRKRVDEIYKDLMKEFKVDKDDQNENETEVYHRRY